MIGKLFFWLAIAVIVGGLAAVYMIRNVSHDPALWHVDPLTVPTPTTPNSFRMVPVIEGYDPVTEERIDLASPIYDANPALISQAFDEFVLRQPRTQRIAGTPETGWMTYVQQTELMRFPDYISVLFLDLGNGQSTVAIFSRSRYGRSDLGVNGQRVERWLEPLSSFVAE
ncbi:Uncharacterized conserved protein, DUF1499 family [Monaibacterium marinum]|uniref:Uncharacterized conserved protein, DUF1499 family n=1 Tax=Pontivivens marinum TaxID=1690039 RepID=A0A2C9CR52_9RHOB|nr:DUF1499 domain-containing protein [Monaibacterium marinum]SOH93655.1 Uncharacterized conserved protein, DUF1499 family [Monaibacterium marinum]